MVFPFDGHEKTLNNHLWNKATDQKNMNIIDKVLATTLYGFINKKIQGADKPFGNSIKMFCLS